MGDNKLVRLLTYVTGLVNQELLLQNKYLAAEEERRQRGKWLKMWYALADDFRTLSGSLILPEAAFSSLELRA